MALTVPNTLLRDPVPRSPGSREDLRPHAGVPPSRDSKNGAGPRFQRTSIRSAGCASERARRATGSYEFCRSLHEHLPKHVAPRSLRGALIVDTVVWRITGPCSAAVARSRSRWWGASRHGQGRRSLRAAPCASGSRPSRRRSIPPPPSRDRRHSSPARSSTRWSSTATAAATWKRRWPSSGRWRRTAWSGRSVCATACASRTARRSPRSTSWRAWSARSSRGNPARPPLPPWRPGCCAGRRAW